MNRKRSHSIRALTRLVPLIGKLGVWNMVYIAWYRWSMRTGLRKWFFPAGRPVQGTFYRHCAPVSHYPEVWKPPLAKTAEKTVDGRLTWFWKKEADAGDPPGWFTNPFDGSQLANPRRHWTRLDDFELNTGDVKILWEPSRFYWLTDLARAYRVFGDPACLETMNSWLNGWSGKNPVNLGPNWKCGQEASIRILNLVTAAAILRQDGEPTEPLRDLVSQHLNRVNKNIRYALAQQNNHATSEAAGLFVGASFLLATPAIPSGIKRLQRLQERGRKLLEAYTARLIDADGSFSQHSVNYHRMLLDTLILTEYWRRRQSLKPFSDGFYRKTEAAARWLELMVDSESGRAPNLGANDGSRLLNLHGCPYPDYRPTLQAAGALFGGRLRYGEGAWNETLYWFGVDTASLPLESPGPETALLDNRYLVIARKRARGVVKLPGFPFRPSQNDTFHLDLWADGVNVACDAGTFSYYRREGERFASVASHNSVQFGGMEPMPKIGRFLHTKWIPPLQQQALEIDGQTVRWQGEYSDFRGNTHRREVIAREGEWVIRDDVSRAYKGKGGGEREEEAEQDENAEMRVDDTVVTEMDSKESRATGDVEEHYSGGGARGKAGVEDAVTLKGGDGNRCRLRWHLPAKKEELQVSGNRISWLGTGSGIELVLDPGSEFRILRSQCSLWYNHSEEIAAVEQEIRPGKPLTTKWILPA